MMEFFAKFATLIGKKILKMKKNVHPVNRLKMV
jgi:hypothetical protein